MRPVIGITTYAEEATWGRWSEPAAFIPLAYVHAVERAGGRPLLVPPVENGIDETLDALDAIIFSGGGDLDPETYGAERAPGDERGQAARATVPSSRSCRPRSAGTCRCSPCAAGARC